MDAQSGILGSFLPMIGGAPLEWALVLLLYAMIGGELLRRRPEGYFWLVTALTAIVVLLVNEMSWRAAVGAPLSVSVVGVAMVSIGLMYFLAPTTIAVRVLRGSKLRPIAQAFAAMAVGVGISSGFARVLMGKWW